MADADVDFQGLQINDLAAAPPDEVLTYAEPTPGARRRSASAGRGCPTRGVVRVERKAVWRPSEGVWSAPSDAALRRGLCGQMVAP